jgi:Domain of unknown function (DUF3560)
MITITHTHEGGTLIEGSSKGDGVYEVLKGLYGNWRYFPSLRQIGIGQSRDKAADTYKISRAAEALRAAGHEVSVEVDNAITRTFAEAEAGRYERADDRAERSARRSETATANGERMWSETSQVYEALNGQPILVGHHSERRHRNLLDKTHAKEGRAVDEIKRGRHWASRAAAAERYRDSRENVPTTLRRIEKLEAEERQIQRRLDGTDQFMSYGKPAAGEWRERLLPRQEEIAGELEYWREHVAARQADGVKVWSKTDFAKGDYMRFYGRKWYEVLRVNAKTVTIPAMINGGSIVSKDTNAMGWTDTIPYHEVTGRKSAEEMAAIVADPQRVMELMA